MDEVAADVQESASTALDSIVDAGWVHLEVAEEADDGAKFSDAALVEQFAEAEPLGIAANHEGLADLHASTRADGEESFGLRDGEADGLFAENMLAGFGGLNGPGDVEMIGKRIVDSVDIRIGEKFLI
jgi:hypothetical protein